jgi:hypothetical protein
MEFDFNSLGIVIDNDDFSWCSLALRRTRRVYPDINMNGITTSLYGYRDIDLSNEFVLAQILKARNFLYSCNKNKQINRKHSSYGLKHTAEKFPDPRLPGMQYVSNGAFIVAAIGADFFTQPISPYENELNVLLNISSASVKHAVSFTRNYTQRERTWEKNKVQLEEGDR